MNRALLKYFQILVASVAATLSLTAQASAESYSKLQGKGFNTSALTRGPSGAQGWIVSNGSKKFFCKLDATMVYVGKTGLVSVLSNGRQIKIDRKTFENAIGGPDPNIPQMSDLRAGRPAPKDVGVCSPAK